MDLIAVEHLCGYVGDIVLVPVSIADLRNLFICHLLQYRVNAGGGVADLAQIRPLRCEHSWVGSGRGGWHYGFEVHCGQLLLDLLDRWRKDFDQAINVA